MEIHCQVFPMAPNSTHQPKLFVIALQGPATYSAASDSSNRIPGTLVFCRNRAARSFSAARSVFSFYFLCLYSFFFARLVSINLLERLNQRRGFLRPLDFFVSDFFLIFFKILCISDESSLSFIRTYDTPK